MGALSAIVGVRQSAPEVVRLHGREVRASYLEGELGGFYFVDGLDEAGRYFSGAGDTPTKALDAADAALARALDRSAPLTALHGGWAIDG